MWLALYCTLREPIDLYIFEHCRDTCVEMVEVTDGRLGCLDWEPEEGSKDNFSSELGLDCCFSEDNV